MMKKLFIEITEYLLSIGELDEIDYDMSMFEIMSTLGSFKSKWDREFKDKYFDNSCYVDFENDFENISILEVTDEHIKVIGFDDGYEGYELMLCNKSNKISLISSTKVDEKVIEDPDIEELYNDEIKIILSN
jgi:hypothetical protein